MTAPGTAAALVREHADSQSPKLGSGRLICIDGPSGSGKTTLADELVRIARATVIHTDQLCPGWDGLPEVPTILAALLTPLAEGRPSHYREWDWTEDRLGATVQVEPSPLLIIEGLGSGARTLASWTSTLVWLDADADRRRTRAVEHHGDYYGERWTAWAAAEEIYFAAESVFDRANLTFRTG